MRPIPRPRCAPARATRSKESLLPRVASEARRRAASPISAPFRLFLCTRHTAREGAVAAARGVERAATTAGGAAAALSCEKRTSLEREERRHGISSVRVGPTTAPPLRGSPRDASPPFPSPPPALSLYLSSHIVSRASSLLARAAARVVSRTRVTDGRTAADVRGGRSRSHLCDYLYALSTKARPTRVEDDDAAYVRILSRRDPHHRHSHSVTADSARPLLTHSHSSPSS